MLQQVSLLDAFKWRHSVRAFGAKLSSDQEKVVNDIIEAANNVNVPFHSDGVKVCSTKESITSYGVINNEYGWMFPAVPKNLQQSSQTDQYLATIDASYKCQIAMMNMSKFHIGTVWLSGSYGRKALEKTQNGKYNVFAGIPFGNPSTDGTFISKLMKKFGNSNIRKEIDTIFFDVENKKPFTKENSKDLFPIFESLRWGPSAMNKQPWRFCVDGKKMHFFADGMKMFTRIDMGIAMANAALLSEEVLNHKPEFYVEKSEPTAFLGGNYLITCNFRD
ncbi:hypothetical protein TRFO_19992 [Tritrichomonas foetus]|uniref:Putative nitroreductase TM1586 domain-containing protein n=1 Tax=Tritrichomonas foetus TaxID=1144522 RepID=A0A1J4KHS6_9EUKA|nr:hypothetical protein TRFO_19992 [Tritrichomonas foetus]|eukprot:OHT10594.1 hypothetical protein TRFO_19992 [Tritrichomonas foetus]